MSQDFKGSDLMPWEEMSEAIRAQHGAIKTLQERVSLLEVALGTLQDEVAALNEETFDVEVSPLQSAIYGVCKQCDRETMLNVAGICEGCSLEGQING